MHNDLHENDSRNRKLSVPQYHALIDSAVLQEGDPFELLEGALIRGSRKTPGHSFATRQLRRCFARILPSSWDSDSHAPLTLSDSEPEPDLIVYRGDTRDYADRHPGADDVPLVVEVADDTLERDRSLKKRIYARERVPVYWIVNLVDSCIEVYTAPSGPGEHPDFAEYAIFRGEDQIEVVIYQIVVGRVTVRELLP